MTKMKQENKNFAAMNRTLIALIFSLLPLAVSAHSLWIEELPDHAGLGVRFAQWGDEYEVSPGHLDSFSQVSGWTLDEKRRFAVLSG
jgi:hypothetical protein